MNGKKYLSPVVCFQLTVILAAAVFFAAVKIMGGQAYQKVREYYEKYAFCSVITEQDSGNDDFMRAAKNDFKGG